MNVSDCLTFASQSWILPGLISTRAAIKQLTQCSKVTHTVGFLPPKDTNTASVYGLLLCENNIILKTS